MRRFADRMAAGRELAPLLAHLRDEPLVVLGLPRGGVPVAAEVAWSLKAPLDVIVVRKLGLPRQPEVAMGAIGEGGVRVLNPRIAEMTDAEELQRIEAIERAELDRGVAKWRAGRAPAEIAGRVAVIVDDGVATGATAATACSVARIRGATRVVLAVPVAPPEALHWLAGYADEVVAVLTPERFAAVGQWYADFSPTADAAVTRLLNTFPPC